MDAEFIGSRRSAVISQREKRWSMNSQRLEEIVAELMRPIGDVRRSFDTDLSALLEEYLTEAGLHALEASEEGEASGTAPNFAELALLLQHSASVYGRKVDCLYQHVLAVSDSLLTSSQELERGEAEEPGPEGAESAEGGEAGARRRRRASTSGFEPLELSPFSGAAREPQPPRPPPTLPRAYIELEPRQLADTDRPLTDYNGEPVGLLADFHVAWRLQEGMLVDELEDWDGGGSRSLRPIPLMELQAAIAAAAPPALPPLPPPPPEPPNSPPPTPPPSSPLPMNTPLPLHASTPLPDLKLKKERKRRSEVKIDDLVGRRFKIIIDKEMVRRREFAVDARWVAGVLRARRRDLRLCRERACMTWKDFRGFDSSKIDIGGFPGWSAAEALAAAAAATATTASQGLPDDSDDDGFFEQSSLGDSDASRADVNDSGLWSGWQAEVVRRAEAGAARGLDVRSAGARVLQLLQCGTMLQGGTSLQQPPLPAPQLLSAARDVPDVAGLFLATLFLANAGNVEIIPGPPLTLNSFTVRFMSATPALGLGAPAPRAPGAPS